MFAAVGRLTHRHRRSIVVAWIALLVLGFGVGGKVFGNLSESEGSASSESVRGMKVLSAHAPTRPGIVAVVDGASVHDPAVVAAVRRVSDRVEALPYVNDVRSAYDPGADSMLQAPDGRAGLVLVTLKRSTDMAAVHDRVEEVRSLLHGSVPGARVLVGGDQPLMADEMMTTQQDLFRGQMIVLPILLLALLLVFRGWRAALLPVFGAVVTVAGALLLLLGATQVIDVAGYAVDVVALFGLALAVDYSLLMVSRFREERMGCAGLADAVERTVAAAGRTITFSALTVIASLSGLLVFDNAVFRSLAVGGIATVLVALAAGMTLVPAMLSMWGARITAARPVTTTDGVFGRLARRVQRRPVLVTAGVTAVLLAAGAPFLGVSYSNGDHRVLPTSMESRQATDVMVDRFPGMGTSPVQVVGYVAATDPRVTAYAEKVRAVAGVENVMVQPLGNHASLVSVVPAGEAQGPQAQRIVEALHADRPGYESVVTGEAAFLMEFRDHIADRLPFAVALIVLATFVLLFLMTGSVLVPLKALVMNTLSLGATFGALVWVFQDGHLSSLLGFDAFGSIELWVPIVVFVFSFGLSMDYEVFLLARIKESYDESGDSDAAVADGLQRSGRIITSAAVLVMIAFLGFAVGDNLGIKEMGLALTVAVAVDATLVRCLLVPATMTLLGEANWWAPSWLRRIHARYGLREAPAAAQGSRPLVGTAA